MTEIPIMNSIIKVSVIVPVYNVEKYLDDCLESIINQTYHNIEIILVDDGSKDNSPHLCELWAKRDSRIKIIHKENAGLGMARNTGLDHARGDYVYFVDSDDYIELNLIETCVSVISKYPYDIIHFGYRCVNLDGRILSTSIPLVEKKSCIGKKNIEKISSKLLIDIPSEKSLSVNLSACMCMIKRSLIEDNKWRFVSERDILSEDVYSLMKLYNYIESSYFLQECFYNYRQNPVSLTHIYRSDRFNKVKHFIFELKKLRYDPEYQLRTNYMFVSYSISCLKQIVGCCDKLSEKHKQIDLITSDSDLIDSIYRIIELDSCKRRLLLKAILKKKVWMVYVLCYLQNRR